MKNKDVIEEMKREKREDELSEKFGPWLIWIIIVFVLLMFGATIGVGLHQNISQIITQMEGIDEK